MNGLATLLLTTLAVLPMEGGPVEERVDLIEINHFYDEQGRLVFDQTIFYDWSASHSRYMVRAWRLVKNPAQLPIRDWRGGGFVAVWHDGEVLRHVSAQSMRETWTQYDPELRNREVLPRDERNELRKRKPYVREFPATQP